MATSGLPKHGANSARTKKCKKYRAENRRAKNKAKNIEAQTRFAKKQQAKNVAKNG